MSGGMLKELSIWSCYRMYVPSLLISTVNNWITLYKNSRASKIGFTFYMITQEHMLQSRPAKNHWSLDGLPFLIRLTLQIWLLLTITCFDLSPITCMRKSFMTKVISKGTCRTFSAKSLWTFTNPGSFLYQSVGDRLFIAMEHISLKTNIGFKI